MLSDYTKRKLLCTLTRLVFVVTVLGITLCLLYYLNALPFSVIHKIRLGEPLKLRDHIHWLISAFGACLCFWCFYHYGIDRVDNFFAFNLASKRIVFDLHAKYGGFQECNTVLRELSSMDEDVHVCAANYLALNLDYILKHDFKVHRIGDANFSYPAKTDNVDAQEEHVKVANAIYRCGLRSEFEYACKQMQKNPFDCKELQEDKAWPRRFLENILGVTVFRQISLFLELFGAMILVFLLALSLNIFTELLFPEPKADSKKAEEIFTIIKTLLVMILCALGYGAAYLESVENNCATGLAKELFVEDRLRFHSTETAIGVIAKHPIILALEEKITDTKRVNKYNEAKNTKYNLTVDTLLQEYNCDSNKIASLLLGMKIGKKIVWKYYALCKEFFPELENKEKVDPPMQDDFAETF